ncbi:MAG: hypothetical protein LKK00_02075 [Intestinimonas sp.]|nr:hypothetical protein [Intestinimonas sp.]
MKECWSEASLPDFSMQAFADEKIEKTLFVLPVLDMEQCVGMAANRVGVNKRIIAFDNEGKNSRDFRRKRWNKQPWSTGLTLTS